MKNEKKSVFTKKLHYKPACDNDNVNVWWDEKLELELHFTEEMAKIFLDNISAETYYKLREMLPNYDEMYVEEILEYGEDIIFSGDLLLELKERYIDMAYNQTIEDDNTKIFWEPDWTM